MKKRKWIIGILLIFGISQIFAAPCGDVNSSGTIDIVDALMTAQFCAGLSPQPFDEAAAEVSGDGTINIIDALQLAQFYVGIITTFPGCSPATPLPYLYELQAEDADWENGSVETEYSGYTGSGYINTVNASGTWIEWSVNLSDHIPAYCDFRYACAYDNRPMDMSVNGAIVASLDFPASGAWTSWASEQAPAVNLVPGPNTIRLTAATSGGAPNMDKMDLTLNCCNGVTPTPTPTPVPVSPPPPTGTPVIIQPPEWPHAFPGAEGYGIVTSGGRGGSVYEVTNLNSSGSGSLGEALSASGARTVVFRVGGTIIGDFTISNDNITVAGQTAPGDGIAINGHLTVAANNVILRYFRIRGDGSGDTLTNNHNSPNYTQIYDHLSVSWSGDEAFSVYFNKNITIQYCMITEACSDSHKFGGIWGNHRATYHHNLFAHNTDRNPRIASGSGYNDFRNNVIYNWKNFGLSGGEAHEAGEPEHTGCWINVVANYIKPGPGTPSTLNKHAQVCSPWSRDGAADYGDWYVSGNYAAGHPDVTADNWLGVFPRYTDHIDDDRAAIPGLRLAYPAEYMLIRQQTAEDAYQSVLDHVGCALPRRDSVDARIIEEVRNGTAAYGDNGFISSPDEVGGAPALQNGTAPADSDHDGMPDVWEINYGLDPDDAADRNDIDLYGYTMLEKYINALDNFLQI